ncbi:MAG: AraC family transcriptional regulator [Balneolaceae bacterium]|nr:MAG: AraC family transcriptional regulator [Balneolaceae bacterium]
MGYTRITFWRLFEAHSDATPQEIITKVKIKKLLQYLENNPDCKSKEAARAIHLQSGNSLYQYVKKHIGCTPTELRKRVRENRIRHE